MEGVVGLLGLIHDLEDADKRNKKPYPSAIIKWRKRWIEAIEKEKEGLFHAFGAHDFESLKSNVQKHQKLMCILEINKRSE